MSYYLDLILKHRLNNEEAEAKLNAIWQKKHQTFQTMQRTKLEKEKATEKLAILNKTNIQKSIKHWLLVLVILGLIISMGIFSIYEPFAANIIANNLIFVVVVLSLGASGFLASKITDILLKRWQNNHQEEFKTQEEHVNTLNIEIKKLEHEYLQYQDKEYELRRLINEEKKTIQAITDVLEQVIIKLNQDKSSEFLAMLDSLIAEEIAKREDIIIDTNIQRKRT